VPAPAHNAVHSRIKRVAIFICDATPRYRITLTQTARRPFIPGRAGAHPYRKGGDPVEHTGYWLKIYRLEGGTWKKRVNAWDVTPAPAPKTTPSPPAKQ